MENGLNEAEMSNPSFCFTEEIEEDMYQPNIFNMFIGEK